MKSFIHKIDDGSYKDSQTILAVDSAHLNKALLEKGWRLLWLCDFTKKKNPLNEALRDHVYEQRTWKYLIWEEKNELHSLPFWSAFFSDTTDEERASHD